MNIFRHIDNGLDPLMRSVSHSAVLRLFGSERNARYDNAHALVVLWEPYIRGRFQMSAGRYAQAGRISNPHNAQGRIIR